MSVLLINPPWKRRDQDVRKRLKVESCLPSLGLGYIAAMLEKNGKSVKILDATVQGVDLHSLGHYLNTLESVPDYIGITATTTEIIIALEVAQLCKNILPETTVVLGGVHATVLPDSTLANKNVDFVIRGEGEYSLLELVRGKNVNSISGLSYKQNGKIIHNPPPRRIEDLDKLPFPAFHLMPVNKYHPPLGLYRRLPAINIITSRGCPNMCTYCATHTIWGNTVYLRSVGNIIEEIKYLTKDFGIKEISISDDTFTLSKKRVTEFCERILKDKIDLTWSCNSRVEKIDEQALKLMKKAGCHHICYGIESADEKILKNIKKNIDLDRAKTLLRLTKKAGITCRASFMFGNPGETEETMQKTLDFVVVANPDFAVFNITTPYPGTPMYKWAKEKGYLMDEDWFTYHGSNVHLGLPTISPEKIEEFHKYAFRQFYFRPKYIMSRLSKIRTRHDIQFYLQSFLSIFKL